MIKLDLGPLGEFQKLFTGDVTRLCGSERRSCTDNPDADFEPHRDRCTFGNVLLYIKIVPAP